MMRRFAPNIRSIAIKPGDHKVWLYKGNSLLQLKKYEESLDAFNNATELNANDFESWTMRGLVLQKIGRYSEANLSYDRAIRNTPDYHLAWYNQACCYALQSNANLAFQYLKQAISLNANYKRDAKTDSDFDPIREDERFKQLLEE